MKAETRHIRMMVNGTVHDAEVEVRTLLSDLLRHELGYTGTHVGCEQGVCGACTVLLDGKAVRSCLMLAPQADGTRITTVESLGDANTLHPLQESFHRHHGLQCGFCTAGILMSTLAEANAGREVDEAIEAVLPGHLCRCTGYVNIRAAIREAWPHLGGQG